MSSDAGEDVGEPGLGIDPVHLSRDDETVHRRGAMAAAIRRDVMMPGVWAARLSSPIRSIRYSESAPSLSPIRCTVALAT